ncbi:MAG: DUF4350 domain-containing protein [Candidatus Dormibacteria bacterium]
MSRRSWRGWALPAGILAVGAILTAVLAPPPQVTNSDPSSFATGTSGTWALYHLAAALGARPDRLTGSSFSAALRAPATLVEAAPSTPFASGQVVAVMRFLGSGGRLVFALGGTKVDAPLLAALGLAQGAAVGAGPWRERLPLGGQPEHRVLSAGGRSLGYGTGPAVPLLGPSARPVAIVERVGSGEAVVLDSEAILSNALLRQGGNAAFATAVLGLAPGRRVIFDEIHHGYSLGDGAQALLLGTPLGLVTIMCAVLLLAFLITSGRRLGRPLPPPELVSVRTTDDHLDAVAQLYARASDRRAVAARYLQQLRARIGPSAGRSSVDGLGDSDLVRRQSALVVELEMASQKPIETGRLRLLAEQAHRLGRELQGGSSSEEVSSR